MRNAIFSLSLIALLPACIAPPIERSNAEEWVAQVQSDWAALDQQKATVAWDSGAPKTFVFPGTGEIEVRQWYLEGWPGNETVRVQFSYQNSTQQMMEDVKVVLTIFDREGNVAAASRVRLNHPWGLPLVPGTYFYDEIKVPTFGAHRDVEGWRWEVTCEGRVLQRAVAM